MSSISGKEPIVWKVRAIRRAIAVVAIAYPFVLFFGYLILQGPPVPDSISSYYYSGSMHYVFLVGLISLSMLLVYYQYRDVKADDRISRWNLDTVVSTLAGLFALGVAIFPPAPNNNPTELQQRVDVVHHICTVFFFVCISVIVLFFFTRPVGPYPWLQTWRDQTPEKKRRDVIYMVCAGGMAICGVAMVGWSLLPWSHPESTGTHTFIFWGETVSILFFGVAWLVKGELVPPLNDQAMTNAELRYSTATPTKRPSSTDKRR